jgi:hypothetical protein
MAGLAIFAHFKPSLGHQHQKQPEPDPGLSSA